CLQGTELWTF
nr:immunoglobulin light chain junction region [Macaca mulatta]MOW54835.1 immunoglobulin light chain junction region [Macaca mulatta]